MATSTINNIPFDGVKSAAAKNNCDIDINYFTIGKMVFFSGFVYTKASSWDIAKILPRPKKQYGTVGKCGDYTVFVSDSGTYCNIQIRSSDTWSGSSDYKAIYGMYLSV